MVQHLPEFGPVGDLFEVANVIVFKKDLRANAWSGRLRVGHHFGLFCRVAFFGEVDFHSVDVHTLEDRL